MTTTVENTQNSANTAEIRRLFDEAWNAIDRWHPDVHIYVAQVDYATRFTTEFDKELGELFDAEHRIIASDIEDKEWRRGERYDDDESDASSYSTYQSPPRDDYDEEDEDDRCDNCQSGCFPCDCSELEQERREAWLESLERESLCGGI
jgi:hypothetical protein